MTMEGSQATQSVPRATERVGLVWAKIGGVTVAKISGNAPGEREWRALMTHLRASVQPVILWVRGRVWLGSAAREELVHAVGSSRVLLVVDHDLGRSLAMALRWLEVDSSAYAYAELDRLEADLGLPAGLGERLLAQVY